MTADILASLVPGCIVRRSRRVVSRMEGVVNVVFKAKPETMVEVEIADDDFGTAWNEFVATRSIAHHAYSWEWRQVIANVFRHRPYYLVARSRPLNGTSGIAGVLPLIHFKSILFGRALISVPYLNAGGILADSPEIAEALLKRAEELGRELGVDYMELRYRERDPVCHERLVVRTHKVSMLLGLPGHAEDLFQSFPAKLRSQIRRPTKAGLYARVSGTDLPYEKSIDAFFSVFSEHMRDLGTPVYPKRLFHETVRHFGNRCRFVTIWKGDRPVAAGALIGAGTTAEVTWASALKRASRDSPNMLLYWEAMKTAIADGYKTFDFGRSSPDSGTYRFKEQWGPRPLTLHWYYSVVRGSVPDVNPSSPKFAAMVRCWKQLPLPIANTLGRVLTRSLP